MNWKQFKDQYSRVMSGTLKPDGNFVEMDFSCGSGGAPDNRVGIPEVASSSHFEYNTTANGGAYSGTLTVRARSTGAVDSRGRDIYEAENGTLFVFQYSKGCAAYFDGGALVEPALSTELTS